LRNIQLCWILVSQQRPLLLGLDYIL
jgi:hypothetical protein